MADLAYHQKAQEEAMPHAEDGQAAVKISSENADKLSAAQDFTAWGSERGPAAMRQTTAGLFSDISKILKEENALISTFITETKQVMEAVKDAEWDAEYSFRQVKHALHTVSDSEASRNLKKALEDGGYAVTEKNVKPASNSTATQGATGAPSDTGAATEYDD